MKLRVICNDVDYGAAANVGGPVCAELKTFEISGPAVEALAEWLDPKRNGQPSHGFRNIVGCTIEEVDSE